MEEQVQDPAQEIKRLQRCINDLISLLALPAIWRGSEPSQVVQTLLDVLLNMLSLDFAYARLSDAFGAMPVEILRVAEDSKISLPAQELGNWLGDSFAADAPDSRPQTPNRLGVEGISIFPALLGVQGEIGVIVMGSNRVGFPEKTEGLLLSVAANQASIGLQEVRLLTEQKRIAHELDRRVVERTSELSQAHAQVVRSEERWRSIFENSAVGVILADLNCRFIAANPVFQKMLGYTEDELQQFTFFDVTHEESVEDNRSLVGELLEGKRQQFQIEKQFRRKDGTSLWVRNNVSIVPGTERIPRFLMALSEDITERKHAEEALRNREHDLKLIIDTIPTLVWSTHPDGSVDFYNQHYLDYTGCSPEQARGWGWKNTVHPDDLGGVVTDWEQIRASGNPGERELRLRRHDGTYRWFFYRACPLRDENGSVVKWYGILTDIEDRKRAEEELRRKELFLAKAQRLSATGSFSWCLDTDEIIFSEEIYRIFGFEPGTPVTFERIASRVHPDDLALMEVRNEAARTTGEGHDYEIRLRMPDGSVKYLHTTSNETRDPSGRREYIGAIQDVTQRRLAQDALTRARAELAHVSRVTALSTLTASIAHEINQPLSGIITNASTCLRMLDADPPNVGGARETARRTIRDGNRASEVITRLRALYSKKEPSLESMDLNEATLEVTALSLTEIQRSGVILRHELADDLPLVVGDRIQLQQVLLNLLRNAADAMSTIDDRPKELLIRTEREDGNQVRLSVKDSGIGLTSQAADKIFEAFYTTKPDGMGIGLSISRSIIEAHQGRLWATPNDGAGCTFSFVIPCVLEASADAETVVDRADSSTNAA